MTEIPKKIVSVQFITSLVIAAASLSVNIWAAWSTLLGAMSVVVPAGYMAFRLRSGTAIPEVALAQLLAAEFGKWLLTGLIVATVFVSVESLRFGFFFFGLVATYICGLVVALMEAMRTNKTSVSSGN